jgi:hypothetical protein
MFRTIYGSRRLLRDDKRQRRIAKGNRGSKIRTQETATMSTILGMITTTLSATEKFAVELAQKLTYSMSSDQHAIVIYWLETWLNADLTDLTQRNKASKDEVQKDILSDYGVTRDKAIKKALDKDKPKSRDFGSGLVCIPDNAETSGLKIKRFRERISNKKKTFTSLKDICLWYIKMKKTEFVRCVFFERAAELREDDEDIVYLSKFVAGGVTAADFMSQASWPPFFPLLREQLNKDGDNHTDQQLH